MAEQNEQDKHLDEGDHAAMSCFKAILMVLIETKLVPKPVVEKILAEMRDGFIQKDMPKSAGILELIRLFVVDPQRAAQREAIGKLLREPPKGSA